MSLKIHHFAITVKNIEKSMDFYINKLGFVIPENETRSKNHIYLTLNNSNILLELVQTNENINDQIYGNMKPHIALDSNEIEKDLKILEDYGLKSLNGLQIIPGDVKIFTIIDPDGYYIDVGQKLI